MDIEEYEYEMNEIISKQKEHEQDIKYHEHLREKALLEVIDEQEKIINAMAGDLNDYDGDGLCFYYTESTKTWGADRIPTCGLNKSSHCIECIKQYYEKKVSEDK